MATNSNDNLMSTVKLTGQPSVYPQSTFSKPQVRTNSVKPAPTPEPAPEPQYIIVDDTVTRPSKPVIAQCTPSNYWDEWRAREGIVERNLTPAQYGHELRQRLAAKKAEEERQKEVAERLLKKRKSDEDWGKYFYFYFKD